MKNTKITRKANTIYATYLPYPAYKALVQMGKDHNAEIGENADGTLRLTFNEVETAKNVATKWTADYNANRKVEVAPTPKRTPTPKTKSSKPTATKGKKAETVTVTLDGVEYTVDKANLVAVPTAPTKAKAKATPSSTKKTAKKPSKAKGNAFDYSVIKGKTNSDKNRALHATLVKMGLNDSRSDKYQAVWNARPWAN